jgi:preprotein translocase subunit YajC
MNAYRAGIIFGSFVILLVIFALYYYHTCDKAEKQHQAKIEKFLED